jgi:hypothetical protein
MGSEPMPALLGGRDPEGLVTAVSDSFCVRLARMPFMLPATRSDEPRLADVLPSCLAAVSGAANRLELPRVSRAIVILVDGLGTAALRQRAGHGRFLASRLDKRSTLFSGFPTTTAAALASLTTGTSPGEHGLVGYTALVPASDRVANQLTGWGPDMDPREWQRRPTLFQRAAEEGVSAVAIGPGRYRDSGFSEAVLRGAEYIGADSIAARFDAARVELARGGKRIGYLYVPELDMAAHSHGWQSDKWIRALEELDSAVSAFVPDLKGDEGALLTADHGVIDVPETSQVLFGLDPDQVDGIRHVAGDPRCLQLHFEPGLDDAARSRILDAWRSSEAERGWVLTRDEAIAEGWFGEVDDEVRPRIGDIIVAARKNIAYYDGRKEHDQSRKMVGQHGSWSPDELTVPLLRFGAFQRP